MDSYDDFRVTFEASPDDGAARLTAIDLATGRHATGVFVSPLAAAELAVDAAGGDATREIAPADPAARVPGSPAADVGGRLAAALLAGEIGVLFRRALDRVSERSDRGLRVSLSLGGAPQLLDLPWELLYVRPLFLASQQRTPIVRVVEHDRSLEPARVDGPLRVLGVVASPQSLARLDVAAERASIDAATGSMRDRGLLDLVWLETATPAAVRTALSQHAVHVVHFVGHSDFTADHVGVIYLDDGRGGAVAVDEGVVANLLADATPHLRLVVLNSCKSGRTTAADPQAGFAATLLGLGVPAVVAMQRAITDQAAITFAGEVYTGLLARQQPLDAAVSEARKAMFATSSSDEWATPVLYLRDPSAPLFTFAPPPPAAVEPTPSGATVSVVGSGPVAVGGNVTISGGIAAGRDVVDPGHRPGS